MRKSILANILLSKSFMVKIEAMSSFDHHTSVFLDQPQPLKWNGLPDIQKKNIGIGRIREPVTVKTTMSTKRILKDCVQ